MPDVFDVLRSVDARENFEFLGLAAILGPYLEDLARLQTGAKSADRIDLAAVEPEACAALPLHELQREHAHADQVAAMNSLEALGDNRTHSKQLRTFRGPIARRA